jgi:hypothetical protein
MAANHAARAHAQWSASASARNFACPGAIALTEHIPQSRTSLAAAWGTACHEIAEWALVNDAEPADRVGETLTVDGFKIVVDDEMAETASVFVDYVRERMQTATTYAFESKFSLAALRPAMEAGGTADAVIYTARDKTLDVIDLKGGRGVFVDVKGNKQLRTYAVGAMLAWGHVDVRRVRVTIVQPRIQNPAGIIRSEEFHAADLLDWAGDLLNAIAQAEMARLARFKATKPIDAWSDAYLRSGDHCTFCPAMATCPAIHKKALADAQAWFSNDGTVKVPDTPSDLDTARLVQILDAADTIQNWLNAVRAYAHQLAEGGTEVPGYILVAKRATRAWADEAAAEKAVVSKLGDKAYSRKLLTPAQAEKAIGKGGKEIVAPLVTKESSGTNLVRADKTERAAVPPAGIAFFEPV